MTTGFRRTVWLRPEQFDHRAIGTKSKVTGFPVGELRVCDDRSLIQVLLATEGLERIVYPVASPPRRAPKDQSAAR
jgi:hypothetical protein